MTAANAGWPCGKLPLSATRYSHVMWIWMENHSYGEIIGSAEAPYINSLARQCGLATNYHNVSHPSLPNYIAATSGLPLAGLGPFGSDCSPSRACGTPAPSVFAQVRSWKAYEQSMPRHCDRADTGAYAVRHDPPPYYLALASCARDDVGYGRLAPDLARGRLAAFSFLTPNLIDDMHDGTIAQGDGWLRTNLPTILNSAAYRKARGMSLVTLTDHDTIAGALTLCDRPDFFISEEITALFPENGCVMHVLAWNITPAQHDKIQGQADIPLDEVGVGQARAAASMLAAFNL